MSFHYQAYGLAVASDLELPELLPANIEKNNNDSAASGLQSASVSIRIGAVPPGGLPEGEQLAPFLWAMPEEFYLEVPDIARFLVQWGSSITIDPAQGIDEASLRLFLLGSAFGALLFQRGFLVLHGNAIKVGDECLICVGPSGAGKSTIAAAFMQRGYELLADDVVPIDAQCRAVPGFPRIKLWQDSADKLNIPTGDLTRIRPGLEKFNMPVSTNFSGTPVPVRSVFILNTHTESTLALGHIRGMDRFLALRQNTYRLRYLEGMAMKNQHLRLCGQLAARIELTRITRPKRDYSIDALIDILLTQVSGLGK